VGEAVKFRVLIFVVAYEAESTLARVLQRIPASSRQLDVEVLVIDDSSRDRTFEVGMRSAESAGLRLTVLYNTTNQGYGGNQKLGYSYAAREKFDFVVLLHGDGQYAPEYIPNLLEPLIAGSADAVLGSRMMIAGAARNGGMPLYKFVGNKILSGLQNVLLGTRFAEFHSGFRAYRVAALRQLPLEFNTNDFHFDTEITIQLLLAQLRIVEVPIPTYYGDEICRVNGMRYAKDVVLTTLASRLHSLYVLYDRKFDVGQENNRRYELKLGYASSHTAALEAVSENARVLDIGCGHGDFARELRRKGCIVDGMDQVAPRDVSGFRTFVIWKEPERVALDLSEYDDVLLLDMVEHFKEPEQFLAALRHAARSLTGRPRVIVTTGNVAFAVVRLQALLGNFNYGRRGILDLTHTRLYTFGSLQRLFEQCGYRIETVKGIPAPFPIVLGIGRPWIWLVTINQYLIKVSKGFFSYQIFLVAAPLPTVDALLDDSIARGREKAATVRRETSDSPFAMTSR
jgi:glycosyltransferase involved in cell wall biosynthesis